MYDEEVDVIRKNEDVGGGWLGIGDDENHIFEDDCLCPVHSETTSRLVVKRIVIQAYPRRPIILSSVLRYTVGRLMLRFAFTELRIVARLRARKCQMNNQKKL